MKKIIIGAVLIFLALVLFAVMLFGKLTESVPTTPQTQPETSSLATMPSSAPPTQPPTPPEPTWMTPDPERKITAKQYFVYDVQADAFLEISGKESARIYPASITKLFTCYVAMQYLEPGTVLTVGEEMSKVALGSSVARLVKGDQLTVAQLTAGMLLPSGNDAAYVLAVNAGRVICGDPNASVSDALAHFMDKMNAMAKDVGMTGTHFANPDGIHRSNHYTTFADLAILGKMSLEYPTIMKMAKVSEIRMPFLHAAPRDAEDLEPGHWKNTNYLVVPESEFYCPYATGLKTGKTPAAGNCLLTSFDYKGRLFIIGVFGCPRNEDRVLDTLQLFNEAIGK